MWFWELPRCFGKAGLEYEPSLSLWLLGGTNCVGYSEEKNNIWNILFLWNISRT